MTTRGLHTITAKQHKEVLPPLRKVFISGPYRARTELAVHHNILRARRVAEQLWAKGYAPLCPHLNSAFMGGVASDQAFIDGYLAWLRWADLVVMLDGWEESAGATLEYQEALALKIPIVFQEQLGQLPPLA